MDLALSAKGKVNKDTRYPCAEKTSIRVPHPYHINQSQCTWHSQNMIMNTIETGISNQWCFKYISIELIMNSHDIRALRPSLILKLMVNSLWPSDAISHQRPASSLVWWWLGAFSAPSGVFSAPSHYLNQCSLSVNPFWTNFNEI